MSFGKMTTPIVIKSIHYTKDDDGFRVPAETIIASVHAYFEPKNAAEKWTKGDSISFQTPTIEGTVMQRHKTDSRDKHPWKAEVTEGDASVTAATLTGWFTSVYEPSYATQTGGGS